MTTTKINHNNIYAILPEGILVPENSVFLSGQAGLSGGFQMRAGPGLAAFPAGLAAFPGGLSLNRIFRSKDSLLPLLRKSPKYETQTISNSIIVALPLPYSIH